MNGHQRMAAVGVRRWTKISGLAVLIGLALLCGRGDAQLAGRDTAVVEKINAEQLAAILQSEGYAGEVDGGMVRWKIEGKRTQLLISKTGNAVQFHAAFADGNATLKRVNEWNKSKRFSRTYLDDEGDPHLELDLDMEGGVTNARIKSFLKTCRVSFMVWQDEVVK